MKIKLKTLYIIINNKNPIIKFIAISFYNLIGINNNLN